MDDEVAALIIEQALYESQVPDHLAPALQLLIKILERVLGDELVIEDRYRRLSLLNPSLIDKLLIPLPGAADILCLAGFDRGEDVLVMGKDDWQDKQSRGCYVLDVLRQHMTFLVAEHEPEPNRVDAPVRTAQRNTSSHSSDEPATAKKPKLAPPSPIPPSKPKVKSRRELLAEAAENRLKGTKSEPISHLKEEGGKENILNSDSELVGDGDGLQSLSQSPPCVGVRQGRIADFSKLSALRSDINAARREQHTRWRVKQGTKRVVTVDDLEKRRKDEFKVRANFRSSYPSSQSSKPRSGSVSTLNQDLDSIGRKALELTNEFRKEHRLPPLAWHQKLCNIGMVHSKNMGDGKAGFNHDGFNHRVSQYGFSHSSAAENLAMNSGVPFDQVASVAVDGWIKSPGHRKNLLARHNFCGIAVYRNSSGAYYLTQLFAMAR